jgi:hypothetical protein
VYRAPRAAVPPIARPVANFDTRWGSNSADTLATHIEWRHWIDPPQSITESLEDPLNRAAQNRISELQRQRSSLSSRKGRVIGVVGALMLIAYGYAQKALGRDTFTNWQNQLVTPGLVMLLGVLMLAILVIPWKRIRSQQPDRKTHHR